MHGEVTIPHPRTSAIRAGIERFFYPQIAQITRSAGWKVRGLKQTET
jgi:hypothetical protein